MIPAFPLRSWTVSRAGLPIALLIVIGIASPGFAETTTVTVSPGLRARLDLKSMKAIRDDRVVKQGFDYSCGAAALATLLTYVVKDPVTEIEILRNVLDNVSDEEREALKKKGLSLLDLQRVATTRGHRAQGFRLAPVFLAKLQGPVMVFIKPHGYEHFAVFKGVRGDRVYLADPSLGNMRLPVYEFLSSWLDESGQGIIFVVERSDETETEPFPAGLAMPGFERPELLGARQLLEVGNPHVGFAPFRR